jgi:hypothetical protein
VVAANSPSVLTISSYPMSIGTDGPVESPEIPGDALLDNLSDIFILDQSRLG